MLDLGTVRPGETIYIPFHTFDSNDPSASVTISGLAATDIEVYKDGGTTQRASDAGYTLLDTDGIDFDSTTGIHGISIDLADNTTAGFYAAGSQYWVVIASITVDAATVNFVAATFRIGYPNALINTTIATLASQTSFTLTSGPAEDDALNGMWCLIHDVASAVQLGYAQISDYTGSTKTVTLASGTTFTAAATDNISIIGPMPVQATVTGRTLDIQSTGEVDANVTLYGGSAGTFASGRPEVNTTHAAGTAWGSGAITAASIAASALDGKGDWIRVLATGTAQAGAASTIQLAAAEGFANDELNGCVVQIVSGTGAGQARTISDYVGATDTATIEPDWITNPSTDSVYEIIGTSPHSAAWHIWEEVLNASTHNTATSAGRRLRALNDFGLYEGGYVWIDTVNGTAGTTDFENGTVNNPVDSIADAITIAASVGLPGFHLIPGSSITLAASMDNYEFVGRNYSVSLGNQSVSGCTFVNANITGNDDGSNTTATVYENCSFSGDSTLGLHKMVGCGLGGTTTGITLAEAGTFDWDQCYSEVAGTGTPKVTFGAGNMNLNMRHWSGGIQIENMGASASTDNMSIEGFGQVVEGTCTAGTVAVRGTFTTSGITNLTLSDDARIDVAQINAQVDTALDTAIPGSPTAGSVNDVLKDLDNVLPVTTISSLTAANVNSEVVDVMTVDTYTAPANAADVPASPTLEEAMMFIYTYLRNKKTQTSGLFSLRNDADSGDIVTATVTDDTTTTTVNKIA
jgi:hypothetical protein